MGESVFFGADGGVSGGANLDPGLFVAMYDAACAGDRKKMCSLQSAIYKQRRLYQIGHHQSSILKGLKSALAVRGICSDDLVAPFHHFEEPEKTEVGKILDSLG